MVRRDRLLLRRARILRRQLERLAYKANPRLYFFNHNIRENLGWDRCLPLYRRRGTRCRKSWRGRGVFSKEQYKRTNMLR
jgi:hypothetical protein